jgi:hypothetical protein
MIDLPPPPARIARLPKDARGYPVPWFLAWMSMGEECDPAMPGAEPDFRVIRRGARERAWEHRLCWICGGPMGVHRIYVIGPMCCVNRTTMEPPCHRECAEYAAIACPFLVRPRMRRLPIDMEKERLTVVGEMIERNPGVVCLYEARSARPFNAGNGWLIRLGPPERVDFWAQGRKATRAEIMESITSGLPSLEALAKQEGAAAMAELNRLTHQTLKLLPAA